MSTQEKAGLGLLEILDRGEYDASKRHLRTDR
jgi:hypothetical protein